ncbi:MAG TPA: redoxin domain-containing protein, partial [Planctomycetota bacterium]|nr:redoxin domain-containing protein [Planctomycetota bacterium]
MDAPNVAGEADPVASSSGIEIGGTVPDFELRDSEGAVHRLSSLTDARAIVIALSGVGCPVAKLYAPRLEELSKELRARGVAFLGLNSNAHDDVEEIRAFIKEHRIGFPILKDESHEVADMLGAERTTE